MTIVSERRTVQNPFIRYAQEAGRTYPKPEEALRLRGGEDSPFLRAVLVERLQPLNPGVVTSAAKAGEIVERLRRVGGNIKGNLEAWEYLRGLNTVFVEAGRREKDIRCLAPSGSKPTPFTSPTSSADKSFLRKTAETVQRHMQTIAVQKRGAVYEIGSGALLAEEKTGTV